MLIVARTQQIQVFNEPTNTKQHEKKISQNSVEWKKSYFISLSPLIRGWYGCELIHQQILLVWPFTCTQNPITSCPCHSYQPGSAATPVTWTLSIYSRSRSFSAPTSFLALGSFLEKLSCSPWAYKVLKDLATLVFALIFHPPLACSLRSSHASFLQVPGTHTAPSRLRAFALAVLLAWNALPPRSPHGSPLTCFR